jgi:hypothetical protein
MDRPAYYRVIFNGKDGEEPQSESVQVGAHYVWMAATEIIAMEHGNAGWLKPYMRPRRAMEADYYMEATYDHLGVPWQRLTDYLVSLSSPEEVS